jgi:hypothetical protein
MRRLLVGGGALVILALVVVLIVRATGGDDSSSTTTNGAVTGPTAARTGVAALQFQPYTSGNPSFSISTPGPVRRILGAEANQYGPAAGSSARWTLEVRPAQAGVDLAAAANAAVARRGGAASATADTGTPGPHVDDLVTGANGGTVLLHVAQGGSNLFILAVPLRAGGTRLTGRAVFNQMAGTLRAPGIG